MPRYTLVIGNYNYSSWSLRAWLCLKASKEEFDLVCIELYTDGYKEKTLQFSPSGRVPVVIDKTLKQESQSIWDSLSILEHVREQTNGAIDWPVETAARAHARSIAYEMHSGFLSIRDELPQNLRARRTDVGLSLSCRQQIARVDEIWKTCHETYGTKSGWLFGDEMTLSDIVWIPVALRFVSYGIVVSPEAQRFVDAAVNDELVKEWIGHAKEETESLDFIDDLIPAAESPLVL